MSFKYVCLHYFGIPLTLQLPPPLSSHLLGLWFLLLNGLINMGRGGEVWALGKLAAASGLPVGCIGRVDSLLLGSDRGLNMIVVTC